MSSPAPGVLVVEDDPVLAALLERLLAAVPYRVAMAGDLRSARAQLLRHTFDAVVLDRGLPDGDGLQLLEVLSAAGLPTPVLVLSAFGTVPDRVAGLDAGARDYLVKPFDVDELLARLRALMRPSGPAARRIALGDGWLDLEACSAVLPDGRTLPLSATERDLLAVLAGRPTRVFTREELLERVFSHADSLGAVDTYVYYLRRKLGRGAVETVRGVGYRAGRLA